LPSAAVKFDGLATPLHTPSINAPTLSSLSTDSVPSVFNTAVTVIENSNSDGLTLHEGTCASATRKNPVIISTATTTYLKFLIID
jgi:hypothetical protein